MLNRSKVVFTEADHKYMLGDKELSGITGVISRQLFPKKYDNVPESVLMNAAKRGTAIHDACEKIDLFGLDPDCIEGENYISLKEKHGLKTVTNEYLVSDNVNYASKIDVVFDDYSIADIKTTYILDRDYLRWQLSIYAYLFELNNKEKVSHLYGIWLRGEKAELVEVERIDPEIVKELLACDLEGRQFVNPFLPSTESAEVAMLVDIESNLIDLKKEIDRFDEIKKTLLSRLEAEMEKNGVKTYETDRIKITRILPTVAKTFDKKSFEKQHPDLCSQYTKETPKSGSVRITLK